MNTLRVSYNLFKGMTRSDFLQYKLPEDWVWVRTGSECPKTHKHDCDCEFVFFDVYSGSPYIEYVVKEYLFDLFNDMMFDGIVVNFMISKMDQT